MEPGMDLWAMTEEVVADQVDATVAFKELAGTFGITSDNHTYRPARDGRVAHLACSLYGYDQVPLGRRSGSVNDLLAFISTLRAIKG